MFKLFKQQTTVLRNGQIAREGDKAYFINSDGERCEDIIKRRKFDCTHGDTGEVLKKGTLYFYNNSFNPCDYKSLTLY